MYKPSIITHETNRLNYNVLNWTDKEIEQNLSKWSREQKLKWLKWCDKNGVYLDTESLIEFGVVMSDKEATELMIEYIKDSRQV